MFLFFSKNPKAFQLNPSVNNNSMAKVNAITRSIRTMATSHGSSRFQNLPRVVSEPLECPHEVSIPQLQNRQAGLIQPGNKPTTFIILQQRLSVLRWRTQDVQTPRSTPPERPDTGRTGAESLPAIQQSEWWFGQEYVYGEYEGAEWGVVL